MIDVSNIQVVRLNPSTLLVICEGIVMTWEEYIGIRDSYSN